MKRGTFLLVLFLCAASARAAVQFQKVEYRQGETVCEGLLVFDDSIQGKRPGVLVAHQWKGLTDYEKMRAEMLAQRGYVAFCA
ncbi:MAG TPA: dienelactone hydrolase family protein, partial [Verrucomicrobiae bacterium]